MSLHRVRFLPDAAEAWVPAGATLLDAAVAAHVAIDAPCGDRGICGKCRVMLVSETPQTSSIAPPTIQERVLIDEEELSLGWRLACQARVAGEVTVRVPDRALQPAVVPLSEVEPRPVVRKIHVRVDAPTVEDPASDLSRLRRALGDQVAAVNVAIPAVRQLPSLISSKRGVTAIVADSRVLAIEPGDTSTECYGIAVDLGTTSVVVALADLATGRVLGVESRLNGQANFGADVISRIEHATSDEAGLKSLQGAAVSTINAALGALLERTGVRRENVYEAVVAGNSCMNHLLLGVNPASLAAAPYQPVLADSMTVQASEVGLDVNPHGLLYTLPNIAGFVGSDTVAVILATQMHLSDEVRLAIDLGTNGEIVLGNRDRLLACSTAAGPAFEGARISSGMRATTGAIERVWIDQSRVKVQVIGDGVPIGVCGSGLLDAVAQMRGAGVLVASGRMLHPDTAQNGLPADLAKRLTRQNGTVEFALARRGRRTVTLTQGDVRELQLAKGAIRAGISILMDDLGVRDDDISEILLAGAFGSYISPAAARSIGLVPPVPLQRITAVGNAAGQGTIMALLSSEFREEASRIARTVQYVELSARQDFMEKFVDAMALEG